MLVESLYGGQFTLSTQLMKPNYPTMLPVSLFDKQTYIDIEVSKYHPSYLFGENSVYSGHGC